MQITYIENLYMENLWTPHKNYQTNSAWQQNMALTEKSVTFLYTNNEISKKKKKKKNQNLLKLHQKNKIRKNKPDKGDEKLT